MEYDLGSGRYVRFFVRGATSQLAWPTGFDFIPGWQVDCNVNLLPDACDIAGGSSADTDGDGVPDECQADCNSNGVPDRLELVPYGSSFDCNGNLILDECDLLGGSSDDCDQNGIPDECEPDCNGNGVVDGCDLIGGTSDDCNSNGIPDECDPAGDCNTNGVQDICDIGAGTSEDCNFNYVPDECEPDDDCNTNGIQDICDIAAGTSGDCNRNDVPDTCDLAGGTSSDACNGNGFPDECDPEPCPPSPNPMTFNVLPTLTSPDSVTMEAAEATDGTPPVLYRFDLVSGGPGGTESSWTSSRTYIDNGLWPNYAYTYRVRARDSADPPNETGASEPATVYTPALAPGPTTLSNPTASSLDLEIDPNGNPPHTEFAIYCMSPSDANWDAHFVGPAGLPSATKVWQTLADWGTITAQGMQSDTEYCFIAGARNLGLEETDAGPEACAATGPDGARVVSARSCRDHGPAGWLCLELGPGAGGAVGDNVEPRVGGVDRLEFEMDVPVASVTASVACANHTFAGTVTSNADGVTTVVVTFNPPLPDQDCCEVTLGGEAADSYFVAILAGDVDRDRQVLTADAQAVKQRFQTPVSQATARYDITTDGQITTPDASKVKSRFQNTAPSCP
jgi:hypothetical protein